MKAKPKQAREFIKLLTSISFNKKPISSVPGMITFTWKKKQKDLLFIASPAASILKCFACQITPDKYQLILPKAKKGAARLVIITPKEITLFDVRHYLNALVD